MMKAATFLCTTVAAVVMHSAVGRGQTGSIAAAAKKLSGCVTWLTGVTSLFRLRLLKSQKTLCLLETDTNPTEHAGGEMSKMIKRWPTLLAGLFLSFGITGASIAAPFVPGGAVVTAAVSGIQQMRGAAGSALGSSGGALGAGGIGSPVAGGAVTGGAASAGGSTPVVGGPNTLAQGAASGGSSSTDNLMAATRQMQEMNQSFNLQYLNLQQNMQQENRQFTMMSNIMKTKHDTAKSAINNIR